MRQKAYFYPPRPKNGYDNPYALHFKVALAERYEVAESDNRPVKGPLLSLLHHCFRSDVFLLNWIENVGVARKRRLRTWIVLFCLNVVKWRHRQMVWVLHNIHPHEGENSSTEAIKRWLFRRADLIVTHSRAAEAYALPHAKCGVVFTHHPVTPIPIKEEFCLPSVPDVFIWGSILPYKGVGEFVAQPQLRSSGLSVKILGRCEDQRLAGEIERHCDGVVTFENRKAPFEEIAAYIRSSRYVLFPYIDSCFSSSGALIDTLVLGGIPVAPDTGCFKDLAEEGLCITYKSPDELFTILQDKTRRIDAEKVQTFIDNNSWARFIEKIYKKLNE